MRPLPIDVTLPELKAALRSRTAAVLAASPGAGKTTRVPLALVDEPWMEGRKILMLEPRRLAARTAARFMAAERNEPVGKTIGYRTRMDSRIGPDTRVEVITEGILTRLLQHDPALEGVGLVIFDEFHERSLHADLGLVLCLQAQALLREDLRILIMSATLDTGAVSELLGDAPVIASEGRTYPVETRYLSRAVEGKIESAVAAKIQEALQNETGDVMAFLPGVGEIGRVRELLEKTVLGPHLRICPLHGSLTPEEQDRAVEPGKSGERKVVLATSIAETSLTVEGVRVVVDSGLMRVSRFSPRTGMARLVTVPVSRASADQRRGRAGRLGPGVCYRFWTEGNHEQLAAHSVPEIREADLAPLALELAAWGVADPAELRWLDEPPGPAFAQARQLLTRLGALDGSSAITPHGRRMAELGLHPRLAHMILAALPHGSALAGLACELAALLQERDLIRSDGVAPNGDLRLRVEALRRFGPRPARAASGGAGVDAALCRRVWAEAARWKRAVGLQPEADAASAAGAALVPAASERPASIAPARIAVPATAPPSGRVLVSAMARPTGGRAADADACGILLAWAYPERIAQRRDSGGFLLSGGRGAAFSRPQPLSACPFLVAAELDEQGIGSGTESRIFLAAPLDEVDLERYCVDRIETESVLYWDSEAQAVRARKRRKLDALILKEIPLADPDPEEMLSALLGGIAREGLDMLPWTKASRQLRQRIEFLHRFDPSWPDLSGEALAEGMTEWLAPHLYGMKSRGDLQRLNMADILEGALSWDQRRTLDNEAPTHISVPSGSRIPLDYSNPEFPVLAVRLQEMFGLPETPRIAGGKVPVTLHLLSPAQRPVQVTRDLASFWRDAYFEVKKDLKGRYPKHWWPDDPMSAAPTNRVRPRS